MVAETIGMMSVFAARSYGLRDIVLIGNLSTIPPISETILAFNETFGVNFIIPELSQYGTVIGAALTSEKMK
jgi:type II pantothenate kinase